jgi:hypothetical protein
MPDRSGIDLKACTMRRRFLSLALVATLGLAACGREPERFSSVDVTGAA